MADSPGTQLGHYRLVAPIGSGGFATVYRAVDERLNAEVAIKVLAENHALDPDVRERFISEAQLLRRVASSAIVAVYDIGESEREQPYVVLEYADRGDLVSRVGDNRRAGRSPTVDDVAEVAAGLAAALGAVHDAGVVHRDVKPGNILIMSRGGPARSSGMLASGERLVLGDLGYAKDLSFNSGLTVGGGTAGFRAPEQEGLGQVDHRADIYGASAVVFWMVTGSVPDPDRLGALDSSPLPIPAQRAIRAGLASRPDKRFSSISDWYGALELEPIHGAVRSIPPSSVVPGRTRWWIGVVIALVALAVLAGAAVLNQGADRTTTEDGRTRMQVEEGDVRLAVFGPDEIAVGQTATFQAAAEGVIEVRWVTPTGSIREGFDDLQVVGQVAGEAAVTLVGTSADGRITTLRFPFEVTP